MTNTVTPHLPGEVVPNSQYDRGYRRLADLPQHQQYMTIDRLLRGLLPPGPLTKGERRCLAVASALPTRHLTLNSADLDREELAASWSRLHRRIERRSRRPLVYFGVPARSLGDAGHHIHILLWDYLHLHMLHAQAPVVGFGAPDMKMIGPSSHDLLWATIYVCGQVEPVFGSIYHRRHRDREKSSRGFLRTSDRVLERKNPKLLSALHMVDDRSVSDEELVRMVPRFIISNSHRTTDRSA